MKVADREYTSGWYTKERDDQGPFRWMGKKARVSIKDYPDPGKKYLRITAGHSFPEKELPILEVFVNGTKIGSRKVEAAYTPYVFSFKDCGELDIELKLNRTAQVCGDPRDMGIMVRDIEVLSATAIDVFLDGWYLPEAPLRNHEEVPSRWMKQRAGCLFQNLPKNTEKYLRIEAGHPFEGEENPVLTVVANRIKASEKEILSAERIYFIPLDSLSDSVEIEFKLNKTFPSELTGDSRQLGILVKRIDIYLPQRDELVYEKGFFEWEHREFFPFTWITQNANMFLPANQLKTHKYLSFYAFSQYANFSQKLKLVLEGEELCEIPLIKNWNFYSLGISESVVKENNRSAYELHLSLNKLYPLKYHEEDPRELGAKLSNINFHDDDEIHEESLFFHKNIMLNYEERKRGETELTSYPINLGIDLYAKCNMKPPCVYCLWDWMKEEEEGHIEAVVDAKTFEEYGAFFKAARLLINCSIGEPLMHPGFEQIMEYCTKHNKIMEISTNGQAFTERTIKALLGRPVYLYISLDAATKETYAKIRNDRWDSILPKLVLLGEERKKRGSLPKIHMVFMPMRVNRDDLEEYFRLCQKIGADALILRPLLVLNKPKIEHERGGYVFDYKNELLPREDLEEIFEKCAIYSKKYGVPVANQFSFGMRDEEQFKGKEAVDLESQRF
ncbi:MAG: radical SAM protein [Candidatus Aminicenantes bacterium]|jgi:MoaA/NifB/PqqE/SkfB family radical SAM enzyme